MLGLAAGPVPKFVKAYGAVGKAIDESFTQYAAEVRKRSFPSDEYSYVPKSEKKLRAVD
jgi:3-methyl-2-oxobutanoate hydroxymethyltransferase